MEDALERAIDSLPDIVTGRFAQVMNRLHGRR
jgi:hypothetical protein